MTHNFDLNRLFEDAGLTYFGSSATNLDSDYLAYEEWLAQGKNAGMAYMATNKELRKDLEGILPEAKSVYAFGLFYEKATPALKKPASFQPAIAQYALYQDYHRVMKVRGEQVVSQLKTYYPDHRFRVCVDSVPFWREPYLNKRLLVLSEKIRCSFILQKVVFVCWVKSLRPCPTKRQPQMQKRLLPADPAEDVSCSVLREP